MPCGDLDATISWYEEFTPLVVIDRREDAEGQTAWLANPGPTDQPFVLVLVMFFKDRGHRQPQLAPFAHLGIEMPERHDVDDVAARAREAGCLTWEPHELPPPVGYICALADPDGNVIEISHNQGVYAKVQEMWGTHDEE